MIMVFTAGLWHVVGLLGQAGGPKQGSRKLTEVKKD